MRKDKLWKIEATVYKPYTESLDNDLKKAGIPHNYIENVGKYTVFNLFCENTDPKLNTPMLIKSFNYKPLT